MTADATLRALVRALQQAQHSQAADADEQWMTAMDALLAWTPPLAPKGARPDAETLDTPTDAGWMTAWFAGADESQSGEDTAATLGDGPPPVTREQERERIADYIISCRENDGGRPTVQVFDVLAKHIRQEWHWFGAPTTTEK